MLTLFPFEPPYFEKEGLPTTFVGHSVIENGAERGNAARFRNTHGIASNRPILTLLPGSRRSEIKRLAPVFGEALKLALPKLGNPVVVVPTVPQVQQYLEGFLKEWPVAPILLTDDTQKYDCFAASRAALAASGTVTLELALASLPHAIAYRLNPLTVMAYRRLVRVPFANLVNLLLNRLAMPELLQENCTPENLAATLEEVWNSETTRATQLQAFTDMAGLLNVPDGPPSAKAARTVCALAGISNAHAVAA